MSVEFWTDERAEAARKQAVQHVHAFLESVGPYTDVDAVSARVERTGSEMGPVLLVAVDKKAILDQKDGKMLLARELKGFKTNWDAYEACEARIGVIGVAYDIGGAITFSMTNLRSLLGS